jgi:hypothetical protein
MRQAALRAAVLDTAELYLGEGGMTNPICPHCGVGIRQHEASRCLNAWVSQVVLDKPLVRHDAICINGRWYDGEVWLCENENPAKPLAGRSIHGALRPFSWNVAVAWDVVEEMIDRGYDTSIDNYRRADKWGVDFYMAHASDAIAVANGKTLELAICRAAILALEEVGE